MSAPTIACPYTMRFPRRGAGAARLLPFVALLIALGAPPAYAQLNVLAPAFRNLNGAAVWGSAGFATSNPAGSSRDQRPILKGGFAAFYGPFGGHGDTAITFTQMVSDSSDTTLCDCSDPSSHRIHRHTRSTRELRVDTKRLGGGGKVTMLVGYQHSTSYRLGTSLFQEPVPLGGAFLATVFGPYSLPMGARRLQWYAGVGGTVVRLSDIAVRADTLAVALSTERTLAPEALVMLMVRVAPGYRVMVGASYQYLRFGSISYRAAQPGDRIPAGILATLPQELKLESLHISLGFSFTASGLIPGR